MEQQSCWAELFSVISDEKKAYRQMLELSMQKKDILIKGDVAGLDSIVGQETGCLKQIGQFEARRDAAVDKIAEKFGLGKGQATLDSMIKMADEKSAQELMQQREEFKLLIRNLADCNSQNSKLIDMQLQYSSFFLRLAAGSADASNTYDNSGYVKDVQHKGLGLIDREA